MYSIIFIKILLATQSKVELSVSASNRKKTRRVEIMRVGLLFARNHVKIRSESLSENFCFALDCTDEF